MVEGYMTPARFRALREAAGVTQAEAARWMGVSGGSLCQYEREAKPWPSVAEWRIYRCADWLAEKVRERKAA